MERERFASRLGFLLLSAGCAIGIGNVWRFPYVVGQNGGGIFVVFYLVFLVIVGVPILTMELAVGRASKKSIIREFETLEPAGTKWHWYSPLGMLGNYVLMMFYTTVAGWMLAYFQKFAAGDFEGLSPDAVKAAFDQMLAEPLPMAAWMVFVVSAKRGGAHLQMDDAGIAAADFDIGGAERYSAGRRRRAGLLSAAGCGTSGRGWLAGNSGGSDETSLFHP